MITLKCLENWQMVFIMNHHQAKTAKEMADQLNVEKHKVMLFCQANDITPFQDRKTKLNLKKDTFHFKY